MDNNQLIIGTTGPVPFGIYCEDEPSTVPEELLEKRPAKGQRIYAYIHGDLERRCGFDIPHVARGPLPQEPGEHPCYVFTAEGSFEDALLVLWRSDKGRLRGLICAWYDGEALNWARAAARDARDVI